MLGIAVAAYIRNSETEWAVYNKHFGSLFAARNHLRTVHVAAWEDRYDKYKDG